MENASVESTSRTPVEQKVGDFWAACMNEKVIEESSLRDLAPELHRIDDLQSKNQLADEIAHLHMSLPAAWRLDPSQTPVPFFGFMSRQDFDNASQEVVLIDQGGMGLPSRDFYLRNDEQSTAIRSKYRTHISKSLAKSFKKSMGLERPAVKFHDLPDWIHGVAMQSYYGGRSEVRIRDVELPVVLLDYTSNYPASAALLNTWHLEIAKTIEIKRHHQGSEDDSRISDPQQTSRPQVLGTTKFHSEGGARRSTLTSENRFF